MDEQTQEEQKEIQEEEPQESQEAEETPEQEQESSEESEDLDALTKAQQLAERIEKANAKTEQLLKRQEKLMADSIVSGRGLAGGPQKKKEQSPSEYANDVMSGKIKPKDD